MTLTDNDPMPFGMYKGTLMANVDAKYLLYLYEEMGTKKPFGEKAKAVKAYIYDNLDALKKEAGWE